MCSLQHLRIAVCSATPLEVDEFHARALQLAESLKSVQDARVLCERYGARQKVQVEQVNGMSIIIVEFKDDEEAFRSIQKKVEESGMVVRYITKTSPIARKYHLSYSLQKWQPLPVLA